MARRREIGDAEVRALEREAAQGDEAAAGRLDREAARRTPERPPMIRLRVEDHVLVRELGEARSLAFPDALHEVIVAGAHAIREDLVERVRELERRTAVLDELGRRVLPSLELTAPEASLICDALNGYYAAGQVSPDYIALEVSDACSLDRLDRKWEVEGNSLVARIRGWSVEQCVALVDGVARFWGLDLPTDQALVRCWLVSPPR